MSDNNNQKALQTQRYEGFKENAYKAFFKTPFQKVGENDHIIRPAMYVLSALNIAAGFMFFYVPVESITENKTMAAAMAIVILAIIEVISLVAFEQGVLMITAVKSRIKKYGIFAFTIALVILAFNVYITAEGNEDLIRKIAVKPVMLNSQMNDTLSIIDKNYRDELAHADSLYNFQMTTLNKEYNLKIKKLDKIIDADKMKSGEWTKHNEAPKQKTKLLDKQSAEAKIIADDKRMAKNMAKQLRDSLFQKVSTELIVQIDASKQTTDNTRKTAYTMGIALVVLIIMVRFIRVVSKIELAKDTKAKGGKLIKTTYNVDHEIDEVEAHKSKKLIDKEIEDKKQDLNDQDSEEKTERPAGFVLNSSNQKKN